MRGLRRAGGEGGGGVRKICKIEAVISSERERVVCETVRGIQKGEGGMIENRGGKIGSPHPLLSPSVIPLPFSWLALFGHVTEARAGGERARENGGRMDGLFFFLLFSPSQNRELRSDGR